MGFSGKQALLRAPDFEEKKINSNYKKLEKFTTNYVGTRVHNRATMYEDIEVNDLIKFFKSLKCREDAPQTSFSIYADYLSEWYERFQNGEEKFFPTINFAVYDEANRQRAQKHTEYPT